MPRRYTSGQTRGDLIKLLVTLILVLAVPPGHAALKPRSCAAALALVSVTSVAHAEHPQTHMKCLGRGLFKELVMMQMTIDVPKAFDEAGLAHVPAHVRIAGVMPNRDTSGVSWFLGAINRPLEFDHVDALYSETAGPLVLSSTDESEGNFLLNRVVTSLRTEIKMPAGDDEDEGYGQTLATECYLESTAEPNDWSWINPFSEWPY